MINIELEKYLLYREEIYKEEKWHRKHLRKLIILDWGKVRKKLKKRRKNK